MDTQPDEYNERWNGFSYEQLSCLNNLPGDPYEPDGRNEVGLSQDTAMMNGNRRIRNRYMWFAAEWVRTITHIPLRISHKDGPTLFNDYFLPQNPQAPRRTFYVWPFRGRRNANPRCDLFLFALGKDRYSQLILRTLATRPRPVPASPPASPPSPPSPPASPPGLFAFDGILIVGSRLQFTLPANNNLQTETDDRTDFLSQIAGAVRLGMNYRFFATGTVGGVTFNRVLIHFAPQYLVTNFPNFGPNQTPAAPARTVPGNTFYQDFDPAGAQTVRTNFGSTARVNLTVAAPAAATWNAGTSTLTMHVQNSTDAAIQMEANFPRVIGINRIMTAVTAADVQAIVRLIFPTAVVNHL